MSRLTEASVEELIEKLKVGKFHSVYGPARFGGARIWEVWVYADGEYQTRFIVEEVDKEAVYFDTFVALTDFFNDLYRNAIRDSGAVDWTRTKEMADLQLKRITLYVAAVAFTATVGVVLYQSVAGSAQAVFTSVIAGIVASGGALFFGRWIGNPFARSKQDSAVRTAENPAGAAQKPPRVKRK